MASAIGRMHNPSSSCHRCWVTYRIAFAERNDTTTETRSGESSAVDAGDGIEGLDEGIKHWR